MAFSCNLNWMRRFIFANVFILFLGNGESWLIDKGRFPERGKKYFFLFWNSGSNLGEVGFKNRGAVPFFLLFLFFLSFKHFLLVLDRINKLNPNSSDFFLISWIWDFFRFFGVVNKFNKNYSRFTFLKRGEVYILKQLLFLFYFF